MPQYPVPTTNSIVVGTASGILYMEFEHGDGTAILPGDVIQFNNPPADCTVKAGVADSEEIIGVADISAASATSPPRGSDRVTAYAEGVPWKRNMYAKNRHIRGNPVWRVRAERG